MTPTYVAVSDVLPRGMMTDDQNKKPTIGFWATVVVVSVLLYLAAFGPAIGLYHTLGKQPRLLLRVINSAD
jgi:hypothetical protein